MSDEIEEQESGYEIQYAGEDAKSHFVHKDGLATAWFPNKDSFTGEYKDGKRHGKGKYTFSSGAVYEGDYLNNARHGVGTMVGPDGGRYEGEWQDNKRHGYGKYQYPNGDVYVGNWSKGFKHGDGTYTFANSQGSISGRWIEGQCQSGTLKHPDGAQYVGPFADNKPGGSGPGLFVSAAGHHQSGVFAGTEWKGDHFVRPHPHDATPEPHPADHATAAARAIDRAVLKLDHFQAIYRMPKVHEGVPNFRRVDGFPVFGSGQPTLSGFVSLLTSLGEQGFSKFVWTCMRQEPVIYVNEMSFAPRDRANLNENMEFEGITSELLHTLQESLAGRYRLNSKEAGEVEYYQDTYAENPADRKNLQLKDKVDNPENVRSLDALYTHLRESKNLEVDLHRLPIADERAPSAPDFDKLTGVLKDIDFENTAVLFNCQMGKGRTTTGMVCACLMARVKGFGGGVHNDGEEEKEHDEEEKGDESEEAGAVKKPKAKPVPKHVHENPPNLMRGEFGVINELVKRLPNGIHIKHEVDTAIDGAHHMQNLRECIMYTKEMYDKETEERRKFWKRMSVNFIERYFWLITYHAYLRQAKASEFESSFVQWVKEHADLFEILGTRESGALSVFNWE